MTGRITHQPHRCHDGIPGSYPVGTEWQCDDCGKVWRMNFLLGWLPKAVATPPAETVEADGAVVVAGRIDAITRDAIDEALRDPSRAGNCAAKAHKAILALLADSPLGATSTVSAEPTPEQVEADLAQDEQAHARYYAQPGVPVEKVREAVGYLRERASKHPEGSLARFAYTHAADHLAALLPKEPTS